MRRFIIYGVLAAAYVSALFGCGSQESKEQVVQPSRLEKKVIFLGPTIKGLNHAQDLNIDAKKEVSTINEYFTMVVRSPFISAEEKGGLQAEYDLVMGQYDSAFSHDLIPFGFANVNAAWSAVSKKIEAIGKGKSSYEAKLPQKEKDAFETAYRALVKSYGAASKRGKAFLERIKRITSTH